MFYLFYILTTKLFEFYILISSYFESVALFCSLLVFAKFLKKILNFSFFFLNIRPYQNLCKFEDILLKLSDPPHNKKIYITLNIP